jgi:hypothetical protein
MFTTIRKNWGLQAFLNWIILKFMFTEMERMIAETFMPILRLLVEDKHKLLADYQALVDSRTRLPFYASPYQRWWANYRNFIRENEFALTLLKQHLSEKDFHELVVKYTSERIGKRFAFMKEQMRKRNESGKTLHEEMQSPLGKRMLPVINSMAQFLVGPMETRLDENGTMIMSIPDCAMHRSVSDTQAQELSCLYSCKAACESLFSVEDPMCFEFEPNLPNFDCTLRAYMAGNPVLEQKRKMFQQQEQVVKFVSAA